MTANLNSDPGLAPGFTLRTARWSDLEAVMALIREVLIRDGDEMLAVSPEELRVEWQMPGFTLERDSWVVTAPDGRVVGCEEFNNRQAHASLDGDGYVHPDYLGNGIGTAMLRALEARAREEMQLAEPGLRVFIRNGLGMGESDAVARQMHENEGYKPVRYHWRMQIELAGEPDTPVWPRGVEVRTFVAEAHARPVYEAEQEIFLDGWSPQRVPFETWSFRRMGREDFDPSLWHITWNGDVVAGISLCRFRQGICWVSTLGVRRAWRRQGLGLALLNRSFGEFYRRGMNTMVCA